VGLRSRDRERSWIEVRDLLSLARTCLEVLGVQDAGIEYEAEAGMAVGNLPVERAFELHTSVTVLRSL
jgi:hypothetical protein